MTDTVTDIAELIRHPLALSVDDDETAAPNLRRLVSEIDQMFTTTRSEQEHLWLACEYCGAWVSSDLLGRDGACEDVNGVFCCASRRLGDSDGGD